MDGLAVEQYPLTRTPPLASTESNMAGLASQQSPRQLSEKRELPHHSILSTAALLNPIIDKETVLPPVEDPVAPHGHLQSLSPTPRLPPIQSRSHSPRSLSHPHSISQSHQSHSVPNSQSQSPVIGNAVSASTTPPREPTINGLVMDLAQKHSNGHIKHSPDDNEAESELSEPDSNVRSPSGISHERTISDNEDETMIGIQHEPVVSHYPKRKRNSVFTDLSESKMELPNGADGSRTSVPGQSFKPKSSRQSLGTVRGVLLGHWRDSPIPNPEGRHAVIGFIDVRDRLRTRIQPYTVINEPVSNDYPMPPGPGGSWVTFERVVFSKHLVGLDHFQVKEYVRLRTDSQDESEEEREAAEHAAVNQAIRRVKENPAYDNPATQPAIAHGLELPDSASSPGRPESKRRRVSGGFASINPGGSNSPPERSPLLPSQPALQPRPPHVPKLHGPLPGTRPTRILLGFWKGSSEEDPRDRHAVYGILGQNDMFRVKVVRETRDGRFVDGNFPTGAGALWIQYEEVEFEPHLKSLQRSEIKEYCRVRQYQLDQGEVPEERVNNEIRAVHEAQARAGSGYRHIHQAIAPYHPIAADDSDLTNGRSDVGGAQPELRQSRRGESRATPRQSFNENDMRQTSRPYAEQEPSRPDSRAMNRVHSSDGMERTNALARREIARVEAAQGRADRHALHRERAAALVADAAAAAAAAVVASAPSDATNGRAPFHESEDMQRLNKVWARQESLRLKAGAEDAKMYDGVKYERKTNGPFIGKLVSQGTIINIDGEDYVEYRVLTKPSFF
ncbi:uncharacterized protein TrAtP1_005684 [Trichoderma atroviride]|uniref:uncharacterized protein n=1 Tax=Hypocrea atroviridis TaxID=63577 RepID=UPI003322BCCF|nr:hypothetical protein TrAtP1_005684 [Trichoderma atroviride]